MIRIAVIGARGYVGAALCAELAKSSRFDLHRIHRGDNLIEKLDGCDIVIHAANTGRRFWANQNADADFTESVLKTQKILEAAGAKKIILVSSISARTQLETSYGRHRRACELVVASERNLIVRLGPMYGTEKLSGALLDIIKGQEVFATAGTRYAYARLSYCASFIVENLTRVGLIECGARNTVTLEEIRAALGSPSVFRGEDDSQYPIAPTGDAPDASDVIAFAKDYKTALDAGTF